MNEKNVKKMVCCEIEMGYRDIFTEYCKSQNTNKSKYIREMIINLLWKRGLIDGLGFEDE